MKAARYYIYALLACIAFFVGMHLFRVLVFARAEVWITRGVPLSLWQRILISFGGFWSATWFLFIPLVVPGALFFATLLHVLKKPQ